VLTRLFRPKARQTVDGWHDPALAALRDAAQRNADDITRAEHAWGALESRMDYAADQERGRLRGHLPRLHEIRDVLAVKTTAAEERERLVNELLSVYAAKCRWLNRQFEAIAESTDVPDDTTFGNFVLSNREAESLRLVLFETTGSADFQRGFDAVAAVRSTWHDQHRERTRLFDRVLAPGMRRRHEAPSRQLVSRLTELNACLKGAANGR
jgi:hypothetical protein